MKALVTLTKISLFAILAVVSFSAQAMYVGNPNRPNTIWVPGECKNGCWREGYYMQFKTCVRSDELNWIPGHYDVRGNWIEGHYQVSGRYQKVY